MNPDQRARLLGAKLAALVADLRGGDVTPEPFGAGASALGDGECFVLYEEAGPTPLAAGLLRAVRSGARRLVLFADRGAPVAARLAQWFEFDTEVRAVVGATSTRVAPAGMPVVPPGPRDAKDLLDQLSAHDLEVVLEEGSWRGELRGLEVARLARWPLETGGDGRLHLEAGVGRFDRDATAAMLGTGSPAEGLARTVGLVRQHRYGGAEGHPLSRLARSRWLRADAIADPARVGATTLAPVQTSFPPDSVRDDLPAAALGTGDDGRALVVVFAAGAALDLTPVGADTRELHHPGATLRLAVPPRVHLAATDQLAGFLRSPVDVIEVPPGWS